MEAYCQRGLNPFYIVTYFIKWVKSSWTGSMYGYMSQRSHRERDIQEGDTDRDREIRRCRERD